MINLYRCTAQVLAKGKTSEAIGRLFQLAPSHAILVNVDHGEEFHSLLKPPENSPKIEKSLKSSIKF